jgi:hypothetical protein
MLLAACFLLLAIDSQQPVASSQQQIKRAPLPESSLHYMK